MPFFFFFPSEVDSDLILEFSQDNGRFEQAAELVRVPRDIPNMDEVSTRILQGSVARSCRKGKLARKMADLSFYSLLKKLDQIQTIWVPIRVGIVTFFWN